MILLYKTKRSWHHIFPVLIFLSSTFLLSTNKIQAQMFYLANMPGENELLKTEWFHDNGFTIGCGYVLENSRKKILIKSMYVGNLCVAITIDSFKNVIGITKVNAEHNFIIGLNTYDTINNKDQISVIKFSLGGSVIWSKKYAHSTFGFTGNSISFDSSMNYRIVGRVDHPSESRALFLQIDPANGNLINSTEYKINNSNYSQFEHAERSEYHDQILFDFYTPADGLSGSYNNGIYGLDWFHMLKINTNPLTSALTGDQDNTMALHPSDNINQFKIDIFYRHNLQTFCQVKFEYPNWIQSQATTYNDPFKIIQVYDNMQNFVGHPFIQIDTVGYKYAKVTSGVTSRLSFPGIDFKIEDCYGYEYGDYYMNLVGSIKSPGLPFKTSTFGSIYGNPYQSCHLNQTSPAPTISMPPPVTTTYQSFPLASIASNMTYSIANLSPVTQQVCALPPRLNNVMNFNQVLCPGNTIIANITNYNALVPTTVLMNGSPIPFDTVTGNINLTNYLSAPNDTLSVSFQGVVFTSMDSILTVAPPTIIGIQATPNPAIVCPGQSVTLSGTGALNNNPYVWSGGIQNGVPFYPAQSGIYTVTTIYNNGCVYSTSTQVTLSSVQPSIITSPNAAIFCMGDTLTLTAGGGISYSWTGGIQNGMPFTINGNNTYTVTVADANGCTATATKSLQAVACPPCVADITIATTPYTIPITESSTWIETNSYVTIPANTYVNLDADSTSHVILYPGFKAEYGSVFVAEAYNGCGIGAPLLPMQKSRAIEEEDFTEVNSGLKIYPNPTSGMITVEHDEQRHEIVLYDLKGTKLLSVFSEGKTNSQIDLSNFSKGIYVIRVGGFKSVKVIKE